MSFRHGGLTNLPSFDDASSEYSDERESAGRCEGGLLFANAPVGCTDLRLEESLRSTGETGPRPPAPGDVVPSRAAAK